MSQALYKLWYTSAALGCAMLLAIAGTAQVAMPENEELSAGEAQQHNIATVDHYLNGNLNMVSTYNRAGQLVERTYPAKKVNRHVYEYDKHGALTAVVQHNSDNTIAQRVQYKYKKGTTTETYYVLVDGALRKLRQVVENGAGEWLEKSAFDGDEKLRERELRQFDDTGRLIHWERQTNEKKATRWMNYNYDATGTEGYAKLFVVKFPSDPPATVGPFLWRTFDAAGNVLKEFENGKQVVAHQYDRAGKLDRSTQWAGVSIERVQDFEYNDAGKLTAVASKDGDDVQIYRTNYAYDARGLLVGAESRYPSAGRVVKQRWEHTSHAAE